jgi:vacuolar-type H+-ATPase subunit C/Vma6
MSEYSIVRCHGLATHLLSSQVIDALASSENLREFTDMLAPTDYSKVRDMREIDASFLEAIFEEEMIAKYTYVLSISSGVLRNFLIAYYRRFEVQALTRLLRSKASKPPENAKPFLPSIAVATDLKLDRLMEAKDVDEVVEKLSETRYSSIRGSLQWYHEYDSILPLEFQLKKIYYATTFEALKRIRGGDRPRIGRLLGIEIDIANCFTAIAPTLYGYSKDLSKQLIIPHFLRLEASEVEQAIEADSIQAALSHLKRYEEVLRPAVENKDDCLAETKALALVQSEARKQMREANIGLTYVICYLALHEIERRNLTLLAYAIQNNLQTEGYLVI